MRTAERVPEAASFSTHWPLTAVAVAVLAAAVTVLAAPSATAATTTNGFIQNRGQVDEAVLYYAHGARGTIYFTPEAVVLDLQQGVERADPRGRSGKLRADAGDAGDATEPASPRGCAVWIRFESANPSPSIETRGRLPTRYNYMLGNDPGAWRTGVPAYTEVIYREVWPGIDLIYREEGGRILYRVEATPEADLDRVRFRYEGAERVTPDGTAVYRIETPAGSFTDSRPSAGELEGAYAWAQEARQVETGASNRDDPSWLLWSTFLGGTGLSDEGWDLVFDSSGNVVVAGSTRSADFPSTPGSYDPTHNGGPDAFIAKLAANGSSLVWSTFLGGSNLDWADAIELDAGGNVVLAGTTRSSNFPTTSGAYDRSYGGGDYGDVFIAKLNGAGSALLWSTYLGGSSSELGEHLALDPSGNAVVAGSTASSDFPTTLGAYDRTKAGTAPNAYDAYVTKLNAAGTGLLWSTFLGATGHDEANDLKLDYYANPIVVGSTDSPGFPTTPGAYDRTLAAGVDVFVTQLNASGSALRWSTFLGGNDDDAGFALALTTGDAPVVTGKTRSSNFPTTPGAYDTSHNSDWDVFVTKLAASGSAVTWSTYLGGSDYDSGEDIALDYLGNVWVVGETKSANFPTTPDAFDQSFNGGGSFPYDGIIAKLDASGSSLSWSTFVGGAVGWDHIGAVAFGPSGNLAVTGWTGSTDFPTTPGAFDVTYNGGTWDAFAAKFRRTPAVVHAAIDVNPSVVDLWHTSILGDSLMCGLLTVANTGDDDLRWKFKEVTPGSLRVRGGRTLPVSLGPARDHAATAGTTPPSRELPHVELAKGVHDPRAGDAVERGAGGPDAFGYRWIDSDEPGGPVFGWQDIQGAGTEVLLGDDDFVEVGLPFAFPFYGAAKTSVKICSNGYLTFGPAGTVYTNQPIPDPTEPNDLIALFWDDLNPASGGTIHYYDDAAAHRFIVQYTEVPRFAGDGSYTMQAILSRDGSMLLQYAVIEGARTSGTVGIEDDLATTGLEVVFNADYVHDGLAVLIQDALPWLMESPPSGVTPPGGWQDVECCVDATGLEPGQYGGDLVIESNDPTQPELIVPVNLTVLEPVPAIDLTPTSFAFEINEGTFACDLMSISNPGGEWLLWLIGEQGAPLGRDAGSRRTPVDPAATGAGVARGEAAGAPPMQMPHLELAKDERDPRTGDAAERGAGGPDAYGYRWIDSDEPGGPAFGWQDITAVGTEIFLGDDDFEAVGLPFPFPFYGINRPSVNICSNGYLTFGPAGTVFGNQPIPDPTEPNDLIALFWDDLNPASGGTIHYYHDAEADRFIVQYTDVPHFGGTGTYTMQVVLSRNGTMLYQYLSMAGELTSGTIGIEDALATTGLQIVFNAAYVHDGLAILIEDTYPWMTENPSIGLIPPVGRQDVDVCVDAAGLEPGAYEGSIIVVSTDPAQPEIVVPVTLVVSSASGVDPAEQMPSAFRVYWSSPNPFRTFTTIRYDLPEPALASVRIYDVAGRLVRVLIEAAAVGAGSHRLIWDGRSDTGQRMGSGVYFYRLEAGTHRDMGRLVLLK